MTTRRVLLIAGVTALLLAPAAPAAAKGPIGASIEGDGIDGTIVVDAGAEIGQGTAQSQLLEAVGFFDLVFGDPSGVVLDASPTKAIGKQRITITWLMDGSEDGGVVVQHIYHLAEGGPLTHVEPGTIWDGSTAVRGGWMRLDDRFVAPLVALGARPETFDRAIQMPLSIPQVEPPVASPEPPVPATSPAPAPVEPGPLGTAVGSENPFGPRIALFFGLAAIMGVAAWVTLRRPSLR